MLIMTTTTIFVSYFTVVATSYPAPMPRRSMNAPKLEGWYYEVFAGVVPRRRAHERDLGKTIPMPIVNFESIDSIPSSHVHFLSATPTTPISIAAQDFAQYCSSYDVSLISADERDINASATTLPSIIAHTSHPLRPLSPCPRALAQEFWA
ncbi:hypothetical protein EV421DRAFT_1154931 [Armillaria borealis]|uniref:Uncharacterized protein n=1 Tax=Armillaria borealis TaxID=47425 RepID=A0AA39J6U2_9AGAR|nr:hypothetical protein EV421DRAFT_1154931 [Armillaria borealis]